jgi:hypothetical protein
MSQDGSRSMPMKGMHVNKNAISKAKEMGMPLNNDTKMQTVTNFTSNTDGAPSYTIKEGGTLKKKIQPMAADAVSREYSFVPSQQLKSVTAPGQYDIKSSFSNGVGSKLPHYTVA